MIEQIDRLILTQNGYTENGRITIQALPSGLETVLLPTNVQIFSQGDPLAFFYTVERGIVKVSRVNIAGRNRYCYLVYPNYPLGEEGLFEASQHTETAETLTPTMLYRVDIDAARNAIEQNKSLAYFLAEYNHHRKQQFKELMGASAREKVAWARLEADQAIEMGMNLTQILIGELAGISRERAVQMINGFKNEGVVVDKSSFLRTPLSQEQKEALLKIAADEG